jgi:hypothetical protein
MSHLVIIAAAWKLGISDPSFIAWLIFCVYFVVVFQCWLASNSSLSSQFPRTCLLWRMLGIMLLFLGLNKQLDLHQLALEFAREANASISGSILTSIVVVTGILGIAMLLIAINIIGRSNNRARWALGVIIVLLGLQVLRFLPGPLNGLLVAHVFTEEEGLLHMHIIEIVELATLCAISMLALATIRDHQPKVQEPAISD